MQQQQGQRGKKIVPPHTTTFAVSHIRLIEVNPGKLAAVYLALCQQYVTVFCTQEPPDAFRATLFATPLSERWHRVAIQQAAGIARAFRTNRATAYQDYLDDLLDYHEQEREDRIEREASHHEHAGKASSTQKQEKEESIRTAPYHTCSNAYSFERNQCGKACRS